MEDNKRKRFFFDKMIGNFMGRMTHSGTMPSCGGYYDISEEVIVYK